MIVSIIIANYNYGRYLGRAIQSAQAQRQMGDDLEIIVVDDGSTDNSHKVIEAYKEGVKVFFEENKGLPAAINHGIRHSRGMYIIRLDADDWLDRHACFILSQFLHFNRKIGFVWPDYHVYDEYERVIGRISEPLGAGVMFRKQLLVDIGLYDENMKTHEDKDILIRCAERNIGYHVPLPLYRYFKHGENMTSDLERMKVYDQVLAMKHGDGKLADFQRLAKDNQFPGERYNDVKN